jgi:hypothetical protein
MQDPTLILRDIHEPPAPPWWPPAPGWWLLLLFALLVCAALGYWRYRKRRRQKAILALFDDALSQAQSPAAQVAAMSELLRRAARRHNAGADKLHGDEWLTFLDTDDKARRFSTGAGRMLLEGGFRREADIDEVLALRAIARERFVGWMAQ